MRCGNWKASTAVQRSSISMMECVSAFLDSPFNGPPLMCDIFCALFYEGPIGRICFLFFAVSFLSLALPILRRIVKGAELML